MYRAKEAMPPATPAMMSTQSTCLSTASSFRMERAIVERRLGKTLKDVVLEKFDRAKVEKTAPTLNVKKLRLDEISEGVILEFYGLQDKRLHVAVALDKNTFIHATENQGVRISSFASSRTYLKLANVYEVI